MLKANFPPDSVRLAVVGGLVSFHEPEGYAVGGHCPLQVLPCRTGLGGETRLNGLKANHDVNVGVRAGRSWRMFQRILPVLGGPVRWDDGRSGHEYPGRDDPDA